MDYLALLGVAALAFAAAGCGSGLSLSAVAKAADISSKQTSEHMNLIGTVTAGGKTISMTGDGDFQNDPVLGDMSVSVQAPGQSIAMREIMDGTTVYLSSDQFQSQLPSGKKWVSLDLQQAGRKLGLDVASLESQSPADALAQLKASGGVAKIGTETIDGVQTTHYRATLDPDKLAKVQKQLAKAGVDVHYEPVDVWIDGQGLVRREHLHYATSGVATATTDMTIDLSNYGETVNVAPPSPAETFDPTTNGGTP